MLVAAVAGVAAVVIAHVAGHALDVVVAVEFEILPVVKGGGGPFVLAVALAALARDLPVQIVRGGLVTGLALGARGLLQQEVVEPARGAEALHAGVVAVTGHAIRADELLVKRRLRQRFVDGQAHGGEFADVLRLVAGGAGLWFGPRERGGAGKTVGFQLGMTGDQLAGAHHQVGIDERQNGQHGQIDGQDPLQCAAPAQPQNRKMLRMWPSARTAKTMKIGMWTLRHLAMASSVTASQNTARSMSSLDMPRS